MADEEVRVSAKKARFLAVQSMVSHASSSFQSFRHSSIGIYFEFRISCFEFKILFFFGHGRERQTKRQTKRLEQVQKKPDSWPFRVWSAMPLRCSVIICFFQKKRISMRSLNRYVYPAILCLTICFASQISIESLHAQNAPIVRAEAYFQITPEQMEGQVRPPFSARLMSQRFVFQYLAASPVREPYIFQETIDQEESTFQEQTNGLVTVTAFKAHPEGAPQIWQFSANGRGGDFLYGEVYRLNQSFCCDMSPRSIYYDLHTGNPLFSTTTQPLTLTDHQTYRYIGYDDGVGGETPVEMQEDSSITGLLTYSGRQIAPQKLAIMASTGEEYRQQEFSISINGHPLAVHNGVTYLHAVAHPEQFSLADELLLKVTLFCRCDTDESIEIPIANDEFLIDRAVVSSGVELKLFQDY